MQLNRILAFAFGRYFEKVLSFLKVQQLPHPAKSNPRVHIMASDDPSLRGSYDSGRVACSNNITHDEKRHYKPLSKSKAKENTNIQISCDKVFLQIL